MEREAIRQFICGYEREHGPLSMPRIASYSFVPEEHLHNPDLPVMLKESSVDSAHQLLKDLARMDLNNAIQHAIASGVIVGSLKRRNLTPNQRDELRRLVHIINREDRYVTTPRGNFASKVIKWNSVGDLEEFAVGDTCVVCSHDNQEEWIIQISAFVLFGPVASKYYLAVDGQFYIPGWNGRRLAVHPWTGTTQLVPRHYVRNRLQLSSQLKRKVILFPEPSNLENPSFYLSLELNKSPFENVVVPFYPEAEEFIRVQGGNQQEWFAKVLESDHARCKAQVQWFHERRPGQLVFLQQQSTINYSSIIGQIRLRRRLWYHEFVQ